MRRNFNFSFYVLFEKHFLQCIAALCDFFKMRDTHGVQNQYIKGLCYGKKGFHCKQGGSACPLLLRRLTPFHRCGRFPASEEAAAAPRPPKQGQSLQFLSLGPQGA